MNSGCGGIGAPMERPSVPRTGASRGQAHQSRGCTGAMSPLEIASGPEHWSLQVKKAAVSTWGCTCIEHAQLQLFCKSATSSADCSCVGRAAFVTFRCLGHCLGHYCGLVISTTARWHDRHVHHIPLQSQVWGQHAAWHWGASSSGVWAHLCKHTGAREVAPADVAAAQDVRCQASCAGNPLTCPFELEVQKISLARSRDMADQPWA